MTREEAIHIVKTTNDWTELRAALQELVPELAESEDDKIRKALIQLTYKVYANTNYLTCVEQEKMLAWLEKQGEQKPVEKTECELRAERACLVPKFRLGQRIKHKKGESRAFIIDRIVSMNYVGVHGEEVPIVFQDEWELATYQPEQMPVEWSEEDENHRKDAILAIQEYRADCIKKYGKDPAWADCVDWLKSLRPQEQCSFIATEEELAAVKKDAFNEALDKIEYSSGEPTFDDGWYAALKFVRQKQWKPSEEQIDDAICILEKAAEHIEIPEKYKNSDWLCENEDEFIEDLHRQLRNNFLMAREQAKKKI